MTHTVLRTLSTLLTAVVVLAVVSPVFAQDGYILDGFGGVHSFDGAPVLPNPTPYFGFDVAQSIVIIPSGDGYFVLDRFGGVHTGGAAVAGSPGSPYFGFDIARDMTLVPPPAPRAVGNVGSSLTIIDTSETTFQSVVSATIVAPDDGFLLVTGTATVQCATTAGDVQMRFSCIP